MTEVVGFLRADWAVQNKHRAIVKLLVDGINDLDVLARNSFGRGCVTEAFQCDDTEICTCCCWFWSRLHVCRLMWCLLDGSDNVVGAQLGHGREAC